MWWLKTKWIPSLYVGAITVLASIMTHRTCTQQHPTGTVVPGHIAHIRAFIIGFSCTFLIMLMSSANDEYMCALENIIPGEPDF